MKRCILAVLCSIMLLSSLAMPVQAREEPDYNRKGSISVAMTHEGEAVPGGTLTLYRVADVHEENGADYSFRYTQAYANCQASLANLSSADTAQALADYTKAKGISGTKLTIDSKGKVKFADLEIGLYLLVQQDAAKGFEPASPFLVSVPGRENGRYIYDVDASPKLALERAPETTPTEPPPTQPSDDLPQTGMNQWPIPVLAISGLLFVVAGLALYTAGKKKSHES